QGCLVSVDRISDEFAEKARLIKFTESERRVPLRRFYAKGAPEVIDRLKLYWDAAEPISERDYRILVLKKPSAEVLGRYPTVKEFPVGIHGTIFYTREDETGRVDSEAPLLG